MRLVPLASVRQARQAQPNRRYTDRMALSFNRDLRFTRGFVGKHWFAGNIADRIDVGNVRSSLTINLDESFFIDSNACCLESKSLTVRAATD